MKYAIVKNSTVTNIIEWDGSNEYTADGEIIVADDNAYIGGTYDGSFIARPVEPDNRTYAEKRRDAYPPLNDLIVALWEGVVEERMASILELEAQRQAVKAKHPKP